MNTLDLAAHLEAIANIDKVKFQLTANKWLVQVILNEEFTTVYHANPPVGIPDYKASSLSAAMSEAVAKAFSNHQSKNNE